VDIIFDVINNVQVQHQRSWKWNLPEL